MTCTSSDCENGLHCFRQKTQRAPLHGRCRSCGANLIDWPRVHARELSDAQNTFAALRHERIRHHYFHVEIDAYAVNYARRKGFQGLLAINSIRVILAMDLPGTGGAIVWWQSDWELRAHSRQRVIPDALFAIRWPDIDERIFALEVEHHTRAPRRFVSKLLRYSAASYHRDGAYSHTNPIVLVVGHSPTWLTRYRAVLAPLTVSTNVWFASFNDLNRHSASIWQAGTGDGRYSLRTLANLPYGKEGLAANSRAESRPCAADAAHTYPQSGPR